MVVCPAVTDFLIPLISVTDCTVVTINQVVISDETFPFDYDIDQFNSCLSNATVRDNLEAITQKVDQVDYLKIVLSKLQEVRKQSLFYIKKRRQQS